VAASRGGSRQNKRIRERTLETPRADVVRAEGEKRAVGRDSKSLPFSAILHHANTPQFFGERSADRARRVKQVGNALVNRDAKSSERSASLWQMDAGPGNGDALCSLITTSLRGPS
jgi:hypothetical protein